MCSEVTIYPNTYALAKLPWFDLVDGEHLVLADPAVGPVIDVHTHLALGYGGQMRVDLWRKHERTHHYLPLDGQLDLDIYVNKNFKPQDLKRMSRDLTFTSVTAKGMRETHTAPNLLREMKGLGVSHSVLLPIDFPRLSHNAEAYLGVAAKTEHLLSMGSVHPLGGDMAGKLSTQKALGAMGVKVHPAVQLVAPDHPRAMELYRMCADLDLPILWHCGPVDIEPRVGRYLSQVKHYWRAVRENPRTVFILGHSGALQMEMALELAQRYPNVHLELSSQSLTNVRRIIAEAPADRVMFGSDWPFYHQAIPLAKVLLATEGQPAARARVLHENAASLFGIDLGGSPAALAVPA